MALFKAENMSFEYPGARNAALESLSFEINSGEFILVMGRTGSGKSTLLRLLNPLVSPYGAKSGSLASQAGAIAFVGPNPDVTFVSETVRGELAFTPENEGLDNSEIAMKIGEFASFFNLSDMLDRRLDTLSGGEKAAVSVAAAMINGAGTLILDEPCAQLDSKSAFDLINLIRRVNSELGFTVIMSTHLSDGLMDLCDRLLVLEEGRIVFFDSPEKCNDGVLAFYPLSARLFEQRPLSVKQAVRYAGALKEKPTEKIEKTDEVIKLSGVTFAYGRDERDVLDNLSFKAFDKKIHCIIGSNGCGKTTLLKVIAGIKKPYAGRVRVKGKTAYLPQDPRYLFTKESVGEEISPEAAERFGLSRYMNSHPLDLSTGQMQKLALAILSCQDYDILLLDEPSKALDAFFKSELTTYLKSLGKTVIIVSHDLDFVGDTADFVSFLSDGVITAAGERRQVLSSLDFYTTQLRRITKNHLSSAVSQMDLI